MLKLLHVCLLLGIAFHATPWAAKATPSTSRAGLDSAYIHELYLEGDFEKATSLLESALKEGRVRTHADSIFTFKHLGVMYAADANSREKGKYYMLQLVTIEPTARIMDMYASDMIYMIFKNIQEEYEMTRGKLSRAQRHLAGNQATQPEAAPAPAPAAPAGASAAPGKPASKRARNYLLAGGAVAVLVGAGVAAHYIMEDEPSTGIVRNEIPR